MRPIHFDLPVHDMSRATTFFTNVFGWQFQGWGDGNEYQMASTGDAATTGINGGFYKRSAPEQAIMNHIGVTSINDTIPVIERNGGKMIQPKTAITGMGFYALFHDTEENVHGLFENDPSAS